MIVDFKVLSDKITIPAYQTAGSAGLDLQAVIDETLTLQPNEVKLIGTGIAINIDNEKYMAVLAPRSGTGHKRGIVLGNLVGIIDSDYQGELKLSVWNRSTTPQSIEPLERIAQLLFVPVERPVLRQVDEFAPSARGASGFGSTGTI